MTLPINFCSILCDHSITTDVSIVVKGQNKFEYLTWQLYENS